MSRNRKKPIDWTEEHDNFLKSTLTLPYQFKHITKYCYFAGTNKLVFEKHLKPFARSRRNYLLRSNNSWQPIPLSYDPHRIVDFRFPPDLPCLPPTTNLTSNPPAINSPPRTSPSPKAKSSAMPGRNTSTNTLVRHRRDDDYEEDDDSSSEEEEEIERTPTRRYKTSVSPKRPKGSIGASKIRPKSVDLDWGEINDYDVSLTRFIGKDADDGRSTCSGVTIRVPLFSAKDLAKSSFRLNKDCDGVILTRPAVSMAFKDNFKKIARDMGVEMGVCKGRSDGIRHNFACLGANEREIIFYFPEGTIVDNDNWQGKKAKKDPFFIKTFRQFVFDDPDDAAKPTKKKKKDLMLPIPIIFAEIPIRDTEIILSDSEDEKVETVRNLLAKGFIREEEEEDGEDEGASASDDDELL
jgi:hypothetical protein